MTTAAGVPDEYALNIYCDGSSFPNRKRAAGVGVRLVWMNEAGDEQTQDFAPTGWQRATIDEMEIQACSVGLTEACSMFPDMEDRFRKVVIFSDSQYVTENFTKAMHVWPSRGWRGANGIRVANVELWKKLRRAVDACPLQVHVKWVKGHKASVHNKAADKLAKQSAAKPFNRPLSVTVTTSKWSDRKTQRGCVPVHGQELKIRIIGSKFISKAEGFEYRYEVIDPEDISFKDVDFVRYGLTLSRHQCLRVRFNSNSANPRVEEVLEKLDPAEYRQKGEP